MTAIREFVIPRVSAAQIGMIAGRSAGIIATGLQKDARRFAPGNNPYVGQIDSAIIWDDPIFDKRTDFGTPVWVDVTFNSVTYSDATGKETITPKITFQAILISVSFPRNIVKTEIQGRNGTVKEYIGEGDAQISFRGIITGNNGHYPIAEVAELMKLIKAPVAIPVISTYLQTMDIDSVIFEDRNLEQEEGGYSYQTFSLNAISDTPQELKITGM